MEGGGGEKDHRRHLTGSWKNPSDQWSGTAQPRLPPSSCSSLSSLFFPTPCKHFSLTLLFAKILVTMATNWRFMSTSSLISIFLVIYGNEMHTPLSGLMKYTPLSMIRRRVLSSLQPRSAVFARSDNKRATIGASRLLCCEPCTIKEASSRCEQPCYAA